MEKSVVKEKESVRFNVTLGVDAGNLTLIAHQKELPIRYDNSSILKFTVRKKSKVIITVKNSWLGRLKKQFTLEAGSYLFGDACYIIPEEKWMDYLYTTNFMQDLKTSFNTGGDGSFPVEVVITELEDKQ